VPVVPSCLLEPAWAGSAPCSMSAAMVSSRSFSQGIRWAATAAGCRAGWCLSTWWPRWVHGSGYERIASPGCSDRTIRRRLAEWAELGLAEAPCGGERAGPSPVDRRKGGC
jgi:hypothetical protein